MQKIWKFGVKLEPQNLIKLSISICGLGGLLCHSLAMMLENHGPKQQLAKEEKISKREAKRERKNKRNKKLKKNKNLHKMMMTLICLAKKMNKLKKHWKLRRNKWLQKLQRRSHLPANL